MFETRWDIGARMYIGGLSSAAISEHVCIVGFLHQKISGEHTKCDASEVERNAVNHSAHSRLLPNQ